MINVGYPQSVRLGGVLVVALIPERPRFDGMAMSTIYKLLYK